MTRIVAPRLLGMIVVLFLVTLFTYVIFFLLSADPAVQICGKNCTPERIEQIRAEPRTRPAVLDPVLGLPRGSVHRSHLRWPVPPSSARPRASGYSFQTSQLGRRHDRAAPARHRDHRDRRGRALAARRSRSPVCSAPSRRARSSTASSPGSRSARCRSRTTCSRSPCSTSSWCSCGWLPFPQAVTFADDPVQWFLNLPHAVDRARGRLRRRLHAAHPRQRHRHPAGELHAHRAGEGPAARTRAGAVTRCVRR